LIQAIKKREPGFGRGEEIAKSNKLLPTGAAWKMYINPAGTIDLANWVLGKLGKQPMMLPPFPDTPPLVAGVNFAPTSAEARLALPSSLIDGIGDYVIKVRQVRVSSEAPIVARRLPLRNRSWPGRKIGSTGFRIKHAPSPNCRGFRHVGGGALTDVSRGAIQRPAGMTHTLTGWWPMFRFCRTI